MKIKCLMDNIAKNDSFCSQHGLSVYVETDFKTILADSGQDGLFIENAGKLGVHLSDVDMFFLSHGHYDHGGGIESFLKINSKAKVYLKSNAFDEYVALEKHGVKYIGLDGSLKENERIIKADYEGIFEVSKGTWLFSDVTERKYWPEGNRYLKKRIGEELIQDSFSHEQYLVLEENGRYCLISGCAHNGIVNILNRFNELFGKDPDVVISGFHMMKKRGYSEKDIEIIEDTANILKRKNTVYYTGHCTSIEGYRILKDIMKDSLHYLHAGDVIEISL